MSKESIYRSSLLALTQHKSLFSLRDSSFCSLVLPWSVYWEQCFCFLRSLWKLALVFHEEHYDIQLPWIMRNCFILFFLPSFVSSVSHYFSEILLLNNLSLFFWFQFYFIGSLHAISGYLPWNSFPQIDFMKLPVIVVTYRIIMGRQDYCR